jgi:hypothetical protein
MSKFDELANYIIKEAVGGNGAGSISVPNFLDNPPARTVVKMGDEDVTLYWYKRSYKFIKAECSNPRIKVSVNSLNRYIREWDDPDITLSRVVAASMSEPGAEEDSYDNWIDGAYEDRYAD